VRRTDGLTVDDLDWDHTVFALISPDALARHLGTAVLDRMEAAGFVPVSWRVLWHRPADLDSFHGRNISAAWQTYLYRLVDQLFAFGPTIALLLADETTAAGQSSHQRLRLAKGASDPDLAGPGSIRGDLASINVMLALMHSADTAADSATESTVFFGQDGYPHGADLDELRNLLGLLAEASPPERRGYRQVLAGLRARSLAAAWEDLPRPVRKSAGALLEAGESGLASPASSEQLAGLLPAAHPLTDVLLPDFTPGSPGPELERVAAALGMFGTDMDAWDKLVLATSRRFWPRGVTRTAVS
jgi:nucleoside diphosphate kinase